MSDLPVTPQCDVEGCAAPAAARVTVRRWYTASLLSWLWSQQFPERRWLCRRHMPSPSEFIRGGAW
jgi:hypothetical protein